ncbi:MAG TPA: PilZ domain-containing protein [Polyangia bacterium]
MEHRRSDRRYDRRLAIDIAHEGASFDAYTRNISLGGVFIEGERSLPFGARVRLRFRVPTQSEPVEVDGQVRWVEMEDGQVRGLGIRFEGLRARDVWALNKFFEQPVEA